MSAQLPEFVEKLVLDGTKVGWHQSRIAAWRRGERIAPITIDCATTRACQAACSWCFAQLQANAAEGKITRQNFFDFLSDAAEIGVKGVSFISDGESTLVPWYADAIEHAATCGLAVGAGSNGIKLTKSVLERVLPHLAYLRFNFSAGERLRYAQIMGLPQPMFDVVIQNIRDAMEIVRRDSLPVTVNMQLVLDPKDGDQIVPFAKLAASLRPSYAIIKHASDSIDHAFGIDYEKYAGLEDQLHEAEQIGKTAGVRIAVKWNKIKSCGKRHYNRCFGAPFMMQISGSGLVAPCGMTFNDKFKAFHIGNITETRFRDIWAGDRYKEVMDYLASEHFDPRERCSTMCLQHSVNGFLFDLVNGDAELPTGPAPPHLEFI